MANEGISAVAGTSNYNSNISQNSYLDNSQISSMLMSGNLEPNFASMLIKQMSTNNVNSILFGNQDDSGSSSSGNLDIFNTQSSSSQSNFSVLGQNSAFSSISPQFEMSVYSSLIGKTVTAKKPLSGEQISGKVSNVQIQNGKAVLEIDGNLVPTENLLKIQ